MGKPGNRCDALIRGDAVHLLHILHWQAARKREGWMKEIEEVKGTVNEKVHFTL
jgi:hypothetical protein